MNYIQYLFKCKFMWSCLYTCVYIFSLVVTLCVINNSITQRSCVKVTIFIFYKMLFQRSYNERRTKFTPTNSHQLRLHCLRITSLTFIDHTSLCTDYKLMSWQTDGIIEFHNTVLYLTLPSLSTTSQLQLEARKSQKWVLSYRHFPQNTDSIFSYPKTWENSEMSCIPNLIQAKPIHAFITRNVTWPGYPNWSLCCTRFEHATTALFWFLLSHHLWPFLHFIHGCFVIQGCYITY
jgi:hypothetical protein